MPTVCHPGGAVDQRRGSEMTLSVSRRPSSSSTPPHRCQPSRNHPQTQEKRQDWKALRMLSAILLAFIVTWSPYNLFTVIQTFCTTCINPTLYAVGKSNLCTSFTAQSNVDSVHCIVNCLIAPPRNILTYLLTYKFCL